MASSAWQQAYQAGLQRYPSLFDSPARIRAILGGPAGVENPKIQAFIEELFQRGYSKISTCCDIRSAKRIVTWAGRRSLSLANGAVLGKRQVDRFADATLVLYALNQATKSTQLRAAQELGSA